MQTSEEIKRRLNYGAHELRQILQVLATVSDRIQTTSDEIQVCNDRADLIDPTIDELKLQIQTLNEEMDRVYSLRNHDSEIYLRQENAQLKRELAALQQALSDKADQHQAHLAESVKSNAELVQRIQSLDRFNTLLKTKINEMQEQYDSAIIDNVDLRDTNAGLKGTVQTLQSTSAFNPTANTPAATSDSYTGNPKELVPDIAAHPVSASSIPGTEGASQIINFPQSRPKARGIVRGTAEANESFERVKRALAASALAASALASSSLANIDNNTTAIPKSRLNPAVREFTPSNSSSKESANSGSIQASSPSKNESNLSGTATNTKEGSLSPHLYHAPEMPVKEKSITPDWKYFAMSSQNGLAEETEPVKAKPRVLPHLRHLQNHDADQSQLQRSSKGKNKENVTKGTDLISRESAPTGSQENVQAATTPGAFARFDLGLQAWLDTQEKAYINKTTSDDLASTKNDRLIEIDSDSSPKAEKKTAPLPPGYIPVSVDNTSTKTERAMSIKTNQATSSNLVHDHATSNNPAVQGKEATPEHKTSTKTTEKEKVATFLAEYSKTFDSVGTRYGKDTHKGPKSKESKIDPAPYVNEPPTYNPPRPTGTRKLGALLDDECSKMILKPRQGIKIQDAAQEWKAVRKDGKLVYVL